MLNNVSAARIYYSLSVGIYRQAPEECSFSEPLGSVVVLIILLLLWCALSAAVSAALVIAYQHHHVDDEELLHD